MLKLFLVFLFFGGDDFIKFCVKGNWLSFKYFFYELYKVNN